MGKLGIGNISSISSIPLRRGKLSQIRRALPSRALLVVDNPNSNIVTNSISPKALVRKLMTVLKWFYVKRLSIILLTNIQ